MHASVFENVIEKIVDCVDISLVASVPECVIIAFIVFFIYDIKASYFNQ